MSDIEIQKGIPVPRRSGAQRVSTYDFIRDMKDGESFDVVVPLEEGSDRLGNPLPATEAQTRKAHGRQSYIGGLARSMGVKVITRWLPNGDEFSDHQPVVRVWYSGPVDND